MIRPEIPFVCILLVANASAAPAFEVETHRAISEKSVGVSLLPEFVSETLYSRAPRNRDILGDPAETWVGEGAVREDDDARFFNHFHDPTRSWDRAGLFGIGTTSSALYAQDRSGAAGDATWRNARREQYHALVETNEFQRDRHVVEMLKILGHQIHFVQDACVTSHTRGDPHAAVLLDPEPLETHTDWLRRFREPLFDAWLAFPVRADPALLQRPSANLAAPAPIANLIDTTDADGWSLTAATGTAIGAAEFTNANFFSADTILSPRFPFPRLDSLGPRRTDPAPWADSPLRRIYRSKIAHGVPVELFVAEGALSRWFEPLPAHFRWTLQLDSRVAETYASILLPRAVGYSAALLDFFVRGDVEVTADAKRAGRYQITNRGAEEMEGTFEVLYDDVHGNRWSIAQVETGRGPLAPGASVAIAFALPSSPPPATPGELLVVFRGRLGLEGTAFDESDFAVIAKRTMLTPSKAPPGVSAGLGHRVLPGAPHTHQGASAYDLDGDLASYSWRWISCPAACPSLSKASGSLSGGASSVPVPGPSFVLENGGFHALELEVRDAVGHRSTSTTFHQIDAPPFVRAYRLSGDGGSGEFPNLSVWSRGLATAYVGEEFTHPFDVSNTVDEDLFVPAEITLGCEDGGTCGQVVSVNFESPIEGEKPGMVLLDDRAKRVRPRVVFTRPGRHRLELEYPVAPPYFGFWWTVEVTVR